jgi:hypothetical protein
MVEKMDLKNNRGLARLTKFLLPVLAIVVAVVIFSASIAPGKITASQAKLAARDFINKKIKLTVTGKLDLPTGRVYEISSSGRQFYFQVSEQSGEVVYASLGEIKSRPVTKATISRRRALKIALSYAKHHSDQFKTFKIAAKQADFFWPKPTYWTFVWNGQPPYHNKTDFAKVTVDALTGKVVSYGIGNRRWAMFCLPDKKQAKWADR